MEKSILTLITYTISEEFFAKKFAQFLEDKCQAKNREGPVYLFGFVRKFESGNCHLQLVKGRK